MLVYYRVTGRGSILDSPDLRKKQVLVFSRNRCLLV
jgi:hypothetical protein